MTASTGPSAPAGGQVRWRRRLLIGLVLALGAAVFIRSAGIRTAEYAGLGLGAVALIGLVLWRGPKLRKHLQGLGGHRRTGGLNYPGQRGKGLRQPFSPGHRRHAGGAGAGTRHRLPSFRGAGFRAGSHRRQAAGAAGARHRPGQGIFRRNGSRRGLSGGSGASRRGSGHRFAPGRSRAGVFRRSRGVSGRSRAGSGGFRGSRAGSRGAGSRRRSVFRPAGWRRRPAGGTGARGGAGRRPAAGRRSLFRPAGWFRRAGGRRGASGGSAGGGSPRVRRAPGRLRRGWWRVAGSPGARAGRGPGRARRTWWRAAVGPARYAGWRLRGSPGLAGSRGTRRQAMRGRRKAWRARLKANPQLNRHRPRYAPWRLLPGGRPAMRHRAALGFRRWRWRHGLHALRSRQGRPLTWRERISRRWHILRGHPGSGTILLGRRKQSFRRRLAARLNLRARRRRRLAPPRPMPAWTGAAGQRVDHHRQYRWMSRNPPAAPTPQPRRQQPAQPAAPNGSGSRTGPATGAGRTGGGQVDTGAMADEIREYGGKEFADPQDVHDTLTGMHEIVQAMQDTLRQWAEKLAETGVHPAYAQATAEAAQAMSGISQELEQVTSGGVMRGPGGG